MNAGDRGDGTFFVEGTTAGLENQYAHTCGGDLAPDVLFAFTAPANGRWVFDTSVPENFETYDTLIAARSTCDALETELACDDDGGAGTQSALVLTLDAGESVFIIVDGYNNRQGAFTLRAYTQTPIDLGGACDPEDLSAGCDEGALCWFNEDVFAMVCMPIVPVEAGAPCNRGDPLAPCVNGLRCIDPDQDGMNTCGEPVIVGEGEVCLDFDLGLDCAEGLVCADPEFDGIFICYSPVIIELGGQCEPGDRVNVCAEGQVCEWVGGDAATCVEPAVVGLGANCTRHSLVLTCEEGLFCRDLDNDGVSTCYAPVIAEAGEPCEPFDGQVICREPTVCVDESGFSDYVCVEVTVVPEGGACEPGNELNICAEGTGCADLDVDAAFTCTALTPENAMCPAAYGMVATLATDVPGPWTIDVNSAMAGNESVGQCGGRGTEVVVAFTAPADGLYVAQTTSDLDTVLYAREYCGFSQDLACDDDAGVGRNSLFEFPLTAGQMVYFFVDMFDGDGGPVTLSVELAPGP